MLSDAVPSHILELAARVTSALQAVLNCGCSMLANPPQRIASRGPAPSNRISPMIDCVFGSAAAAAVGRQEGHDDGRRALCTHATGVRQGRTVWPRAAPLDTLPYANPRPPSGMRIPRAGFPARGRCSLDALCARPRAESSMVLKLPAPGEHSSESACAMVMAASIRAMRPPRPDARHQGVKGGRANGRASARSASASASARVPTPPPTPKRRTTTTQRCIRQGGACATRRMASPVVPSRSRRAAQGR